MKCGAGKALKQVREGDAADVDKSRVVYNFKKKWIEDIDLTVVAGTEHQYKQLIKSSLFIENEKLKILLGIDDEIFKPGDVKNARKILNLPLNKKIILCGAVTVAEKRKGFKELVESLNILKYNEPNMDIHIAIAGNINGSELNQIPYRYTLLGRLNHLELAFAFQAADVFVSPSIEDSGPMMVNQSIMCGTPVVSFAVGVSLDLVINGITGYIAKLGEVNDLEKGIKFVLKQKDQEKRAMSQNCREIAQNLSSKGVQIAKMQDIFKSI
jgi:glycosyltransferase involved in cell wall biosynthesis